MMISYSLKDRHSFEDKSKSPHEEVLNTLDISGKVELSLWMACGNHLREINYSNGLIIVDEQVKLVKISMDQAKLSKSNQVIKQVTVNLFRILHLFYLSHWVSLYVRHHNTMSVRVDRNWSWKIFIV